MWIWVLVTALSLGISLMDHKQSIDRKKVTLGGETSRFNYFVPDSRNLLFAHARSHYSRSRRKISWHAWLVDRLIWYGSWSRWNFNRKGSRNTTLELTELTWETGTKLERARDGNPYWHDMYCNESVSTVSVEKLSVWGLGQGGGDGGVAWEGRKRFVYFVCYSRRQQLLNNKQSPTGVKENVTVFNYITKRA